MHKKKFYHIYKNSWWRRCYVYLESFYSDCDGEAVEQAAKKHKIYEENLMAVDFEPIIGYYSPNGGEPYRFLPKYLSMKHWTLDTLK